MVVVVVGLSVSVAISSGSKVVLSLSRLVFGASVVVVVVVDVVVMGGDSANSLSMLLIVFGELLCLAPEHTFQWNLISRVN